jgi:Uma2 family endonuclease
MPVTERTYEQIALEDPERQWELHRGVPREKPTMTAAHNRMMTRLGFELLRQGDWREFDVRINSGRLRRRGEMSYIPDLAVVPVALVRPLLERADTLES